MKNALIVVNICEVLTREGAVHKSNNRAPGVLGSSHPEPQGPYYCAIGSHNVECRDLIDEHFTTSHDWKGYLEDRRSASDADPYQIVNRIMQTVKIAHQQAIEKIS